LHTALKIAPVYGGPVIHMKDASQNALVAAKLLHADTRDEYVKALRQEQAELREGAAKAKPVAQTVSMKEAGEKGLKLF
jgi:5-methyltetrahydrofolate--homocysteine methyltransferase